MDGEAETEGLFLRRGAFSMMDGWMDGWMNDWEAE
jgi:hypothetical protein